MRGETANSTKNLIKRQLQCFVEQGMRVTKDQSHKEKGSRTEINELKYTDQLKGCK